ncbi:MAG: T9SS type A sorting domain-containing protein [Prolixibacteraceae bacterium]|jgi:hypothetical protein|nr:T9SS type A sorting domain-containing protein [Prolixibacteraceae bacterium]
MHKLIITIIFVLAVSSQLFSQEYKYVPFPNSGAVWSEMYSSEETMVVYERFTIPGEDTLINDISYKKLYIFYDNTFNKSKSIYIGGIREDEHRRVYFKGDSVIHHDKPFWISPPPMDEILLYDFSLEIGDTTYLTISPSDSIATIVQDIDTMLFGNTLRKVFYLSYNVEWIEGIGNARGLLYSSGDIPIGGQHGYLICFIQNDIVLYHYDYYDNCFPSTLSADIKQMNPEISVCSTPLEHNIQFKWGNCNINRIEIFDVQGSLVDEMNISNNSNEANYPTERMQSGIYIYRAKGSNGYSQTGRFVVE